jgi:general secretion pathway protein H
MFRDQPSFDNELKLLSQKILYSQRGMTLIEIMVVLAIIAAITGFMVRQTGDTKSKMRVTMRKLSVLSKELHTTARLKGQVYRIAIRLDKEKGYAFWVESGPSQALLRTSEQIKEQDNSSSPSETKNSTDFAEDTSVLKNPVELPRPLTFVDVEVARLDGKITEGMAYIHYFPQGLAEEAAIHLSDGREARWTVAIHPLTGQGRLYQDYVELKDLKPK